MDSAGTTRARVPPPEGSRRMMRPTNPGRGLALLLALGLGAPGPVPGQSWFFGGAPDPTPEAPPSSTEPRSGIRSEPAPRASRGKPGSCKLERLDFTRAPRKDAQGFPLPEGPRLRLGWPGFAAGAQIQQTWFSPDEESLLTRSVDGNLLSWEVSTGLPRWGIRGPARHQSMALAREAGLVGLRNCGQLELREIGTGALVREVPYPGQDHYPFLLDPGAEWIVAPPRGRRDGRELARFQLSSGRGTGEGTWRIPLPGSLADLRLQGESLLVRVSLTPGRKQVVLVLDQGSGTIRYRRELAEENTEAALVRGGRGLALGRLNAPPVWIDLATREEEALPRRAGPGAVHLQADRLGESLLASTPTIWDPVRGKRRRQLPRKPSWSDQYWNSNSIAFSGSGRLVALAQHRLALFDARSGKPWLDPTREGMVEHLVLAPSAGVAASLDGAGNLHLWSLEDGSRLRSRMGLMRRGSPLALARDGSWVTGVSPRGDWVRIPLEGDGPVMRQSLVGHPDRWPLLSEGGDVLVLRDRKDRTYTVHRWGQEEPSRVIQIPSVTFAGLQSRLSGDGSRLAVLRVDRTFEVYDTLRGERLAELPGLSMSGPFSRDGSRFLANPPGYAQTEVWKTQPLVKEHAFETGLAHLQGSLFLSGRGLLLQPHMQRPALLVRDLGTGTTREISHPAFSGLSRLVTDPEETLLATVERDGSALVWDLGELLARRAAAEEDVNFRKLRHRRR